jgi:hypothetical protein
MTKSVRDFILSLILVIYTIFMMVFYYDKFIELFPIIYPLAGLYFAYNSLSVYIPSLNEFAGSKKIFKQFYKPSPQEKVFTEQLKHDNMQALLIFILYFTAITVLSWFIISYLSFIYIFLLFLLLNLADYICVLFWCPFRTIFLKNKCCTTCRITNWDRLMKFWVLIFIPHIVSYILFTIGLIIFIHWEIAFYRHPERFYTSSNEMLRCYHCTQEKCKK